MAVKRETKKLCLISAGGPPPGRYVCRKCKYKFELPSPTGPTEERNRTCIHCGSKDIKKVDTPQAKACPPGAC